MAPAGSSQSPFTFSFVVKHARGPGSLSSHSMTVPDNNWRFLPGSVHFGWNLSSCRPRCRSHPCLSSQSFTLSWRPRRDKHLEDSQQGRADKESPLRIKPLFLGCLLSPQISWTGAQLVQERGCYLPCSNQQQTWGKGAGNRI